MGLSHCFKLDSINYMIYIIKHCLASSYARSAEHGRSFKGLFAYYGLNFSHLEKLLLDDVDAGDGGAVSIIYLAGGMLSALSLFYYYSRLYLRRI